MNDQVRFVIITPLGNYIALRSFYNTLTIIEECNDYGIQIIVDGHQYLIDGFTTGQQATKEAMKSIHDKMIENIMTPFEPVIIDLK